MNSFISSISNREWASLVWLVVFVVWTIFYKPTRESLNGVLKAFFQSALIIPLAIAIMYAIFELFVLSRIGLWSVSNLKTTIIWLITFAFVALFEVAKVDSRKTGLRNITRDILTVAGILVFVTELYSFSLLTELVALPLVTIIYSMAEIARLKPEHAAAAKVLRYLYTLIGFVYFGFSIWKSVEAGSEAITWAVALEFLDPIFLSLGFLPFLYIWQAYVAYSDIFAVISIWGIEKSLVPYARWLAITRIRGDLILLERWRKSIQLERPSNRAQLKRTLIALLALKEREASPSSVLPQEGWSPYLAIQFLAEMGVETGFYHRSFDDEWYAQSHMYELGDDLVLKNNLAYYVSGTEHAATSLKIKLNINDPGAADLAENLFVSQAMHLLEQAVSFRAVERLKYQIASLEPFRAEIPFGAVNLTRSEFTGRIDGYDRIFEITRGKNETEPSELSPVKT